MKTEERLLVLAIPIGFIAFTLPLLYSDTKHMWSAPGLAAEPAPAPPMWHTPSADEETPAGRFRLAATSGDTPAAEALLLEHGGSLVNDAHFHGNTPLFEASRAGQEEMVHWLVEHGAEVDRPNEWGDAAVNEAATMGHFSIAWYAYA